MQASIKNFAKIITEDALVCSRSVFCARVEQEEILNDHPPCATIPPRPESMPPPPWCCAGAGGGGAAKHRHHWRSLAAPERSWKHKKCYVKGIVAFTTKLLGARDLQCALGTCNVKSSMLLILTDKHVIVLLALLASFHTLMPDKQCIVPLSCSGKLCFFQTEESSKEYTGRTLSCWWASCTTWTSCWAGCSCRPTTYTQESSVCIRGKVRRAMQIYPSKYAKTEQPNVWDFVEANQRRRTIQNRKLLNPRPILLCRGKLPEVNCAVSGWSGQVEQKPEGI